jgi:hypothetical protein
MSSDALFGAWSIWAILDRRISEGGEGQQVRLGDSAADIVAPLVFLALVAASWALRPASRTLAGSTKGVVAKPERVVGAMTAAAAR